MRDVYEDREEGELSLHHPAPLIRAKSPGSPLCLEYLERRAPFAVECSDTAYLGYFNLRNKQSALEEAPGWGLFHSFVPSPFLKVLGGFVMPPGFCCIHKLTTFQGLSLRRTKWLSFGVSKVRAHVRLPGPSLQTPTVGDSWQVRMTDLARRRA